MVTGDNIQTAKAIALECGILDSGVAVTETTVIEGRIFRALSEGAREAIAENITVMGRSSPNDKLLLVQALKKKGHVVAATGDGTNDAPALHEMVFGPQPSKYMKLRSECADFRKHVSNWITDLNCCKDLALMDGRACGWQVDASKFIKRLSEKFAEYMDLIQPVQVVVYEMKFGLSIAVSSALERKYSKETNESDIEKILATVYSFMLFPSGSVAESAHVNEALLNKLVTVSSGMTSSEVTKSDGLHSEIEGAASASYTLTCDDQT